jgi:hypothetical protein
MKLISVVSVGGEPLTVSHPKKPFNRRNNRSTLIFDDSM